MHRYIPRRDGIPLSEKIRMKQDPLPLPTPTASRPVSVVGPSVLSPASSKRPSPSSSTPCRRIRTRFFGPRPKEEEEHQRHEERLAEALEVDKAAKILDFGVHPASLPRAYSYLLLGSRQLRSSLPAAPYKVLQAPGLEDDYYRSPMAYSSTCQCLAVALGSTVYRWSEWHDPQPVYRTPRQRHTSLTSLSFSSTQGNKAILAFARKDGYFGLLSFIDEMLPRFWFHHPFPVECNPFISGATVPTEDLLVGDGRGNILHYVVEWPSLWEVSRDTWFGKVTPVAKIAAHTSQICALVWSPNGQEFVSGSNDNTACYFEIQRLEGQRKHHNSSTSLARKSRRSKSDWGLPEGNHPRPKQHDASRNGLSPGVETLFDAAPMGGRIEAGVIGGIPRTIQVPTEDLRVFKRGMETHCWRHEAAIKAIAFCPWQDGLIATGGGLGDKCIHFFHTTSSTPLATIDVGAQVTSLIWSTTRREIAATFGYSHGYAQTEHPYRIVVFSWPSCQQVGAIAWAGGPRALYAIPYPRGPSDAHKRSRTAKEGTIAVASSDETLKFHEVWLDRPKTIIGGAVGILGGSDILEALGGIDKEGVIIR
ncbi:WD repeat domain-containing protein [Colletotrichum orchidophilum]|uniref:WD repeat domain-containing protein n=1 Tax=Colletotrichum orchidophilum TaxID=1209926 RepID=A0A1G4BMB2_9PEZI|nr:WD repeat domain-containing protein [Colletotrichum orchidophilum]OHF02447.1 WD repeat domain-containing protein [Colletotrichum orchidophilum]